MRTLLDGEEHLEFCVWNLSDHISITIWLSALIVPASTAKQASGARLPRLWIASYTIVWKPLTQLLTSKTRISL